MDQILIHQQFDTFEEVAATARAWDVDFLQIEKGRFEANLIQYILKDLQFARAGFNRRLNQQGSPPKGLWTFAITASIHDSLLFKNREVNGRSLMIYPPGSEINAISQSRFDILTFSATECHLELLAEKNKFPGIRNHLKKREVLNCEKGDIESLRFLLTRFFFDLQKNKSQPTGFQSNISGKATGWISALFQALFRAVYHHGNKVVPPFGRLRDGAFKQAMACIHAVAGENLSVKGLVRQTGVSQRTLEYVFQERLGVSPKQYIRISRLNRVRNELRRVFPAVGKVSDIANQFGFWHMGQFARDYKYFFGELPSATLNK